MNLGMKVVITLADGTNIIARNITEIHYNYPSPIKNQIAFESDIHTTGFTYFREDIQEFKAVLEDKRKANIYDSQK